MASAVKNFLFTDVNIHLVSISAWNTVIWTKYVSLNPKWAITDNWIIYHIHIIIYYITYILWSVHRVCCQQSNTASVYPVMQAERQKSFFWASIWKCGEMLKYEATMNCKCWLKWPLFWSWTVFVLFKVGAVVWCSWMTYLVSCRDQSQTGW